MDTLRVLTLLAVLLAPIEFGVCQSNVREDWPCAGGPTHSFVSPAVGLVNDLTAGGDPVLWRRQLQPSFAGLTVANSGVFTVSMADGHKVIDRPPEVARLVRASNVDIGIVVYRLNVDTGLSDWTYTYRVPSKFPAQGSGQSTHSVEGSWFGPKAEPAVDGEWVYIYDHSGVLTCLSADDGEMRWTVPLRERYEATPPKFGYACPPIVAGDKLIVPLFLDDGCLAAIDKENGDVLWTGGSTVKGEGDKHRWDGYSLPVTATVDGRAQVIFFTGAGVMALDLETGTSLWRYPYETHTGEVACMPLVVGDLVFVSTVYAGRGGLMLKVSGSKATPRWHSTDLRNHFSNIALWEEHLYGTSGYELDEVRTPTLRCLTLKTGETKWSAPHFRDPLSGKPQQAQVIAADGKLVVLTSFGDLILAEASTTGYNEISRLTIKTEKVNSQWWPRMALAGRRLFCRSSTGETVCIALDGATRARDSSKQ